MSQDRIEGAARQGFGKVQGALGETFGNTDLQAKGDANEVLGNVQELYGKVVDTARGAADQMDDMLTDEPYKVVGLAVVTGLVLGFLLGRGGRKVVYVRG